MILKERPISEYNIPKHPLKYVLRVNPNTALGLTSGNNELQKKWYEEPYSYDSNSNGVTDNSSTYGIVRHGYGNADKFEYNGMPVSGAYLGHDDSNWLIDMLMDVVDWLAGIMTLGVKIQVIGWTSIFQNIATSIVDLIVSENSQSAVTAENILFNKIQILDINFLNFDTAGGTEIKTDDLVYILRQNVASIYVSIRSLAIIVMLVILIYVGIRMALSTVSGNKAKYKKMFLGWVVGFIIIMFIHYFMIFIINANEQIINAVSPSGDTTVIYDEVRSYAYEISASKGWTGTIIYVFLVYYMIKLLLFYFKRLMVIYILVIMAPITGFVYAIQKIKGKSKTFTMWMKEFSFNVLIQSIHVIIYSLFMNIIYSFMKTANIVNLMLRSEKIIKNIFGLKSNTMKDITDTVLQASSSLMTAYALSKPLINFGKKKIANVYDNAVENSVNYRYSHLENSLQDVQNSKLATDIQQEINRLKQEEINRRKEYNKNAMDLAKNIFGGMKGMAASVPMMFEAGVIPGTLSIINAGYGLNSQLKGINLPEIDESRIDELLKKYGMNLETTPNIQSGEVNNPNTETTRKLNTNKKKNFNAPWVALDLATAGTSGRVKNILTMRKRRKAKVK